MRDTGPQAKASIQDMLEKFLGDESPLRPVEIMAPPDLTKPGPVAPYVPIARARDAQARRFNVARDRSADRPAMASEWEASSSVS